MRASRCLQQAAPLHGSCPHVFSPHTRDSPRIGTCDTHTNAIVSLECNLSVRMQLLPEAAASRRARWMRQIPKRPLSHSADHCRTLGAARSDRNSIRPLRALPPPLLPTRPTPKGLGQHRPWQPRRRSSASSPRLEARTAILSRPRQRLAWRSPRQRGRDRVHGRHSPWPPLAMASTRSSC